MDWRDKMNSAMNYIEANLMDKIDYRQVAQEACCSVYHFQRMFSFITDVPLSEYIRRRRLTLAAFELQSSDIKIIDIAAKCGYESPESFSRAFKKLHGIMPMEARSKNIMLKAYPRMSFQISFVGNMEVNYRIVQKEAYEVCGITMDVRLAGEQTNSIITQFWNTNLENGTIGKFHKDIGLDNNICFNTALYNHRNNVFSYMICYNTPNSGVPAGYSVLSVPSFMWAVFSTPEHIAEQTTELIKSVRKRIFLEWFPTSGYIHGGGPEFEIFNNKNNTFIVEIWIPIRKRKTL